MSSTSPGFEACSGCSLCLLACPVWRAEGDIRFTPHGRAKALQNGVALPAMAGFIDACTLCGTCEPACPESISLVDAIQDLRKQLGVFVPERVNCHKGTLDQYPESDSLRQKQSALLFVPDRMLVANRTLLERALSFSGDAASIATDIGADIALGLESGMPIANDRLQRFLGPLRKAHRIVVSDGLLLRALRGWLPGKRIDSAGHVVTSAERVRRSLRQDDLYVIEPRAFHADWERLVLHYDALRVESGCVMNLDLQRLAIPTTANSLPALTGKNRVDVQDQARWILEGHAISRIVVEDVNDIAVFRSVTDKPVVHLAELG